MYGGSAHELPYMALPAAFLTAKSSTGSHYTQILRENSALVAEKRSNSSDKG